MLGDLLAAAVNPNVGGWGLAPMATEVERRRSGGWPSCSATRPAAAA
jgi:hypothetical protein